MSDGDLTDSETAPVNPQVANAAPTAAITDVVCTDLTCTFKGETSSDPDSDPLTYSWTFGDGATSTDANPSHVYTTGGQKNVTLTVNDGQVNSSPANTTADPTSPGGDPVSNIDYVGSAASNGNRMTHATTLPCAAPAPAPACAPEDRVQVGDTMVAFFTTASATATTTYTNPTGWTQLRSTGDVGPFMRVYTKTATAADTQASARISLSSSAVSKSDLTVAVYRSIDAATPIAASAVKFDAATTTSHVSPAVTAANDTGWLLTYWSDKTSISTPSTLTPPGAVTQRQFTTDTGGGHISALFGDSNGAVDAGARGQLTATANSSSRGWSASILLNSN